MMRNSGCSDKDKLVAVTSNCAGSETLDGGAVSSMASGSINCSKRSCGVLDADPRQERSNGRHTAPAARILMASV